MPTGTSAYEKLETRLLGVSCAFTARLDVWPHVQTGQLPRGAADANAAGSKKGARFAQHSAPFLALA